MKWFGKLILALCAIGLTVYASTPYWLGPVLERQLPDGWQLQALETDYPGLSAFHIRTLRISGVVPAGAFSLTANDMRIGYHGWQAGIDEAWHDFQLPSTATAITSIKPEDVRFPVIPPVPDLPALLVGKIQLHILNDASSLLALDIQHLKLTQQGDNNLHLEANVNLVGQPGNTGRVVMHAGRGRFNASLQIPDSRDSPAWLMASLEQDNRGKVSTARMHFSFDTEATDPSWFDQMLSQASVGSLQHLAGKLEAQADFSGVGPYLPIKSLSLSGHDVKLGTLEASLLQRLLPGFHLQHEGASHAVASMDVELQPSGSSTLPAGQHQANGFDADIDVSYASDIQEINLKTSGLHFADMEVEGWKPETTTGKLELGWKLIKSFSWSMGEENLSADRLSIETTLDVAKGQFSNTGTAVLLGASVMPLDLSAKTFNVSWNKLDLEAIEGNLSTRTSGLSFKNGDETWSGFDFDVHYHVSGNTDINGYGKLLLDGKPLVPLEFDGKLQTPFLRIASTADSIKINQLARILDAAHVQYPETLTFSAGKMDVRAGFKASDALFADASIEGRQVALSLQESKVRDGHFALNIIYEADEAGSRLSLSGPASVTDLALAGGLDLHQLSAELSARMDAPGGQRITIKNLDAQLLDGKLHLPQLKISAQGLEDTRIQLSGIDLARLLAIADIDGLEGSGTLRISIPIGSDLNGIHITDGTFNSTGSGRLAYKKEGMSEGNIGLQALENFEYQSLSGTFNYQSDGHYRIAARLEGSNPDLYSGHAIAFNLDINGTLPKLFEAFFISGDFEEAVLNQIRQN